MKKLLTFFVALSISILCFGTGDQYTWTGFVNMDWQNGGNWTKVAINGTPANVWPGQNPADIHDVAIINDGIGGTIINVPSCTLSRLEISPLGSLSTLVTLEGSFDGATLTFNGGITYPNLWNLLINDNCDLDCSGPAWTNGNRVKIVMDVNTNFWQKVGATFEPALYVPCNPNNMGFLLKAGYGSHAEYIQQTTNNQAVMGYQELWLNPAQYHLLGLPITSVWPVAGQFANTDCRTANCLCVFQGNYVSKFNNGVGWLPWMGNENCFGANVNIETARGYNYWGLLTNPVYTLYGTFNNAPSPTPYTLPITSGGFNFLGNPFPSAIKFQEPSGTGTAGPGWVWDYNFTDPIAYWWDNSVGGAYVWYNWYTGTPSAPPPPAPDPKVIARGQGFFVHVSNPTFPNCNVTLSNDARVFRNSYQIGKSEVTNHLNLLLQDESGKQIDNVYLLFRDDVSNTNFDRLLDAYKLYNDFTNVSQIYCKTTDDIDVAQKSLKLESGNVMQQVYLKVTGTGTYSLDATMLNTFSANTGILLKDNKTNTTVDLKVNPVYTFTATDGDNDARFTLYFSNVLYGIDNLSSSNFKVYSYDNAIFVQNNDPRTAAGTVVVYDMVGKQVMQQELTGTMTKINTNLNKGFYLVSIKTDGDAYNQKVYIN